MACIDRPMTHGWAHAAPAGKSWAAGIGQPVPGTEERRGEEPEGREKRWARASLAQGFFRRPPGKVAALAAPPGAHASPAPTFRSP